MSSARLAEEGESDFTYFVTTAEDLGRILREQEGTVEATSHDNDNPNLIAPSAGGASAVKVVNVIDKWRNEAGEKFLNNYKCVRKLGQGSFGSVKLYEHGQNRYAIKALNKLRLARMKTYKSHAGAGMHVTTALDKVRSELDVLLMLPRHESIVELVEVIEDSQHHKMYLVLSYVAGGHLLSYDEKKGYFRNEQLNDVFTVQQAKTYISQVAVALRILHENRIVHLDIKPENILLDATKDRCVIADFNSAKFLQGEGENSSRISGTHGTLHFLSPEACEGEDYDGFCADAWALAVTFHATLFGVLPFAAEGMEQLVEKIRTGEYHPPTLEQLEGLPLKTALENAKNADLRDAFAGLFDKEVSKQPAFLDHLKNALDAL